MIKETGAKIQGNEVKIYLDMPKEAEVVGFVDGYSETWFSVEKAKERSLECIKNNVAKTGGNGLVIEESGLLRTRGIYGSTIYFIKGKAIYIETNNTNTEEISTDSNQN